jgi:hypothetical protein
MRELANTPGAVPAPLAVDRREAARLLGVSPGTIDNLRARGDLPSLKLAARRLYAVADLANLIASRREGVRP